MLYQDWRANNPTWWSNKFTGGVNQTIYTYVQELIDTRLYNYQCVDDFSNHFLTVLKMNEYVFYNRLMKLLHDNGAISVNDGMKAPHTHSKNDNYQEGQSDLVNDSNTTGDTSSTGSGTSESESNNKGRTLSSALPQSNVEDTTVGGILDPIKWKYATSVGDTGSNSKTDGSTTSKSDSNTVGTGHVEDKRNYSNWSTNINDRYSDFSVYDMDVLMRTNFEEPFSELMKNIIKYAFLVDFV